MRYEKSVPGSQNPKDALLAASLILAQSGFRVESTGNGGIEVRGPGIQHSSMDPLHGISYLRIHIENETIHLEADLEARAWIRNGIYLAFLVFGVMFLGVAILTNASSVFYWTVGTLFSSALLFVTLFFWSLKNNTIETFDSLLRKMQTDRFYQSHSSGIEIQKSCRIEDTTNRIAPAGGEVSNRGENEVELPEVSVSSCGPEGYRRNVTGTFPHTSKPLDSPDPSRVSSDRNVQIGTPETPLHPDRPMFFETEVPYSRDPKAALLMARSILTHTDFRIESFDDKGLDAYGSGLQSGNRRPNAQEGISRLRIRIANETIHFHVELGHAVRKRRQAMLASLVTLILFGVFALCCILKGNYWGALLPLWPGLILFLAIRSLDRYVHESAHEFINTLSQNMRFGGDITS